MYNLLSKCSKYKYSFIQLTFVEYQLTVGQLIDIREAKVSKIQ